MKCRVLKTLTLYDSAIKDVLAYTLWSTVILGAVYMSFKA